MIPIKIKFERNKRNSCLTDWLYDHFRYNNSNGWLRPPNEFGEPIEEESGFAKIVDKMTKKRQQEKESRPRTWDEIGQDLHELNKTIRDWGIFLAKMVIRER
jgi:hypothetical protein